MQPQLRPCRSLFPELQAQRPSQGVELSQTNSGRLESGRSELSPKRKCCTHSSAPGRQRSAQPPAWYLDTSQVGAARHPRCTADSGSPSPLGGSTSCSVWLRLRAPSQHLALSGNGHRRDIGFGSAPGQKPLLTDESVCAAPGPPAHWSNNNLDADDIDIHQAVPARCQPRL